MSRSFSLTFDYRCPYGRIVHDHVVAGLRAGAEWNVTFTPFCLGQTHVEEGQPDVWDRPSTDSGLLALQASVAVRDTQPAVFVNVHHALYEYRHNSAGNLRDRALLSDVIGAHNVDVAAMWDEVDSGRPLATIKGEHSGYARTHHVWGVPVFIVGDKAVFVRLLDRPNGDGAQAIATVERILDNIEWDNLNEFKHTSVPR
jgi:predicted DsbA family dithiol-disulfide isomerase